MLPLVLKDIFEVFGNLFRKGKSLLEKKGSPTTVWITLQIYSLSSLRISFFIGRTLATSP